MGSWLDIHRVRHAKNKNMRGEYTNDTVTYLNTIFEQSPSYTVVNIEGTEHGVRIVNEREYQTANEFEMKKMLLRPMTVLDRGSYVEIEDKTWIIMFFQKHDLYPKAFIRFCNNTLVFDDGTRYPCVINNKVSANQMVDENTTMLLPSDRLYVSVKATEKTRKIKKLQRFIIDGLAWEVQAVDITSTVYNKVGVVNLAIRQVPLKEEEIEKEEETVTPDDEVIPDLHYQIKIDGEDEVEINATAKYTATVYLNGAVTNADIEWEVVGEGTVTDKGQFTAPAFECITTVVAKTKYFDVDGSLKEIQTIKSINIFDNDNWGWG